MKNYKTVVGCFALLLLIDATIATVQRAPASDDIVLMNVTVTNTKNDFDFGIKKKGFVSGLNKDEFAVFDNNVPKQITFFTNKDIPASIGIVVDMSSSIISSQGSDLSMRSIAAAVTKFIAHSNPMNEYFLVNFGNSSQLAVDWTKDEMSIVSAIKSFQPKGSGALLEACSISLDKLEQGKYRKHILIVFTTGKDYRSQSYKELRDRLKASDAVLYILPLPHRSSLFEPSEEIAALANNGGGRLIYHAIQSPKLLEFSAELIALEIRQQYLIGFVVNRSDKDQAWHSLKITTNPSSSHKHLYVRTRVAYFGARR